MTPAPDAPGGLSDTAPTSLPRTYLRSAASNYGYNAIALVLTVATTPFMVRRLGVEDYGIWVLASSFIVYLDLFQLGFTQSVIPFVARARAVGDDQQIREVAATSFLSLAGFAAVAYAVAVVASVFVPAALHVPAHQQNAMRVVMILVATAFCASIPSDSFGSVLVGLGRYDLLFASLSAGLICQAVGWITVLLLGGGLVPLAAVSLVTGLAGQASRWWLANRIVHGLSISPRHFRRRLLRPLAGLSVWFSVRALSITLIERIDTIVVGFVVGIPAAAVYAIGQRIVSFIGKLVRPLSDSLMPHAAEISARDDQREAVHATVLTGTKLSVATAMPVCLTASVFAAGLIHAWVGRGFGLAAQVVAILSAGELIGAAVEPLSNVIRGRGLVKPAALANVGEAVLNLAASLYLGHRLGLVGVAWGTLIARVVFQIFVFLPIALRSVGVETAVFLRRAILPVVPATAAAAAMGALIRLSWHEGLAAAAAGAFVTLATYGVVLARTGMAPHERRRVRVLLPLGRG